MRDIKIIVIHCSDTENGDVKSIRKYHIEVNGWDEIGYHYVILPDGTIEIGRPPDQIGAHVYGRNKDSLGICLIGKDRFTLKQFLSLRRLLDTLKGIYGVGISGVYCHYELDAKGKSCPNFSKEDLIKFLTLV